MRIFEKHSTLPLIVTATVVMQYMVLFSNMQHQNRKLPPDIMSELFSSACPATLSGQYQRTNCSTCLRLDMGDNDGKRGAAEASRIELYSSSSEIWQGNISDVVLILEFFFCVD